MSTQATRRLGMAAAVAMTAAWVAALPAGAAAMHAMSPDSPQAKKLMSSSQPKTVRLDVRTGEVLAVYAGFAPESTLHDAAALQRWMNAQ